MIMAYKAFRPDLSCISGGNLFQYELGVWNEEPEANCARNGFHCAENPLDCLSYYPDWEKAVYYLVLADGDIDEDAADSRISCTRLKLIKRLSLGEFVAHSMNYILLHPLRKNDYRISSERGTAQRGFVIVRGKDPIAKGKKGDFLGFIRENPDDRSVAELGILEVDGRIIRTCTWYDMYGNEKEEG